MALDGITIAGMASEMRGKLIGGRITKIAQPEADELMLTIKNQKEQLRLLLSASASLPLIYFTDKNKPNPATAPGFCMLLRKHIGGGKILSVTQPGLERILKIEVEHLDELGDVCRKYLIIELMGKHSNIIFTDSGDKILDSIKHISLNISSVREVLPGRPYFIPETQHKLDPLSITEAEFYEKICALPQPAGKALYTGLTGISPLIAEEICFRAGLDSGQPMQAYGELERLHLYKTFCHLIEDVKEERFTPNILYRGDEPLEFAALSLKLYPDAQEKDFPSMSQVLETYYAEKSTVTRIRQKSSELRRIVQTALERNYKKYDLQQKQQKDTEKREKYRVYGELIQTYGYELSGGEKSLTAPNYYDDNKELAIPLDPTLSAQENAQKYFERYNKLKRTYEALIDLLAETKAEIDHLESIRTALAIALQEEDLVEIKRELQDSGYIKKHAGDKKKVKITSRPFHYLSSDGFHIYVGKNNFQNEELTFQFANGGDWWFHAKGIPGSHVIVKTEGKELPDRVYEEAGQLAAYYSSARDADKVEVDYIQKKQVKKPAAGKPGFVIYHTNYSLMAVPTLKGLTPVE
ncbi:NFACT family protein [Cuneatibacter sp. NSJ-177]|uniref:Rqc2 family fibronectin-binding protein n=1 Tax=Cuneatibacter sp. NSJ-177 TaxID=2931401 RepID=UPI001FD1587B|nr:NFACT RNA binding domain-containing protein [Cuneatibacter sp. NSJ-177]MCJ7834062.1 NFACT family protein [Cuneatibacter sp. NSJ-177]